MSIKSRIRTIPGYPKAGIQFRDITTLLQVPVGFGIAIDGLAEAFPGVAVDKVVGIEARGFILGGAVAKELGAGFVPVRKSGKLPHDRIGRDYDLVYGQVRIEVHVDAVKTGEKVLLIDDLIATGGTAEAAIRVIEQLGGEIVGLAVVIDLPDVGGRARIEALGHKVVALCAFEGD